MCKGCFLQDVPKKGVRNLLTQVSPFSKERGCQYTQQIKLFLTVSLQVSKHLCIPITLNT